MANFEQILQAWHNPATMSHHLLCFYILCITDFMDGLCIHIWKLHNDSQCRLFVGKYERKLGENCESSYRGNCQLLHSQYTQIQLKALCDLAWLLQIVLVLLEVNYFVTERIPWKASFLEKSNLHFASLSNATFQSINHPLRVWITYPIEKNRKTLIQMDDTSAYLVYNKIMITCIFAEYLISFHCCSIQ